MKTASAAQAATAAVEKVRFRINSFDAVTEIAKANSALRETNQHLKNGAWDSAINSYGIVRESLVRVLGLGASLDDGRRIQISEILSDIRVFGDKLEAGIQRGKTGFDATRAIRANRSHSETLTSAGLMMEKAVGYDVDS